MSGSRLAQNSFLRDGGIYAIPLMDKYAKGEMKEDYDYKEYPKLIRISRGSETVERTTETIKGVTLTWTVPVEMFDEFTVTSEEEEERVLSGGKTSAQIEDERQALLARARAQGVKADPGWSAVRLRRELGDAMDAPPRDEMGELQRRVAELEEKRALMAKIAALEAELAGGAAPEAEDVDALRDDLRARGVKVDGRWNAARLREELEKAA